MGNTAGFKIWGRNYDYALTKWRSLYSWSGDSTYDHSTVQGE